MREKIEVHVEHAGPYGAKGSFGIHVLEGQEWAVRLEQALFRQIVDDVQDLANIDGFNGEVSEGDIKRAIGRFVAAQFNDQLPEDLWLRWLRPTLLVRQEDK